VFTDTIDPNVVPVPITRFEVLLFVIFRFCKDALLIDTESIMVESSMAPDATVELVVYKFPIVTNPNDPLLAFNTTGKSVDTVILDILTFVTVLFCIKRLLVVKLVINVFVAL
jgi:hypothetical protein